MSRAGANGKKSTSTSGNKKVGVTTPARKSSVQGGALNHTSHARIKELEQQVSDLKKRLDELRKAKNTTIIKKDKEYITTGVPHNVLNSMSTGSCDCPEGSKTKQRAEITLDADELKVQRSNQEVKALHENIAAMKEMHRAELEELKTEVERQAKQSESSFASELEKLKKQNRELQEENELLMSKTVHLQLKIDDLLEELSKKEAEWCSKEEKLILEVKTSWGEKYQKWMAQTEQKIEELQTANNFLKMVLEKERPEKN